MTTKKYSKNDGMEDKKSSKSEKQYVRAVIHNLSLSRWTDQEIVDYLYDEKKIRIARSTVNGIKNQIAKKAEKWYLELRDSRYKYIAIYKERIDSLFSYQKKLNQIVDFYMQPGEILYTDTIIRAIAELHRIEMSIFSLWKQLPDLQIINGKEYSTESGSKRQSQEYMIFEEWKDKNEPPRISHDADYTDEENGQYYWGLHKRYRAYVDESINERKAWTTDEEPIV